MKRLQKRATSSFESVKHQFNEQDLEYVLNDVVSYARDWVNGLLNKYDPETLDLTVESLKKDFMSYAIENVNKTLENISDFIPFQFNDFSDNEKIKLVIYLVKQSSYGLLNVFEDELMETLRTIDLEKDEN